MRGRGNITKLPGECCVMISVVAGCPFLQHVVAILAAKIHGDFALAWPHVFSPWTTLGRAFFQHVFPDVPRHGAVNMPLQNCNTLLNGPRVSHFHGKASIGIPKPMPALIRAKRQQARGLEC